MMKLPKSLRYNKGEEETKKHVCGACLESFDTEEEYNAHICGETGFNPTQVEHQDVLTDGAFSAVSEAAIQRGAKREDAQGKRKKKA